MDLEQARRAIQECEAFKPLSQEEQGTLLSIAQVRKFSAGEMIYRKGDKPEPSFDLIVSGSVEAQLESQLNVRLQAPHIVGEIAVISDKHERTCNVVAVDDVCVLEWDAGEVFRIAPSVRKRLEEIGWDHLTQW